MSVTVLTTTRRRLSQVRVHGTSALSPERVSRERAVGEPAAIARANAERTRSPNATRHLMLVPGGPGVPQRPTLPRFSEVVARPGLPARYRRHQMCDHKSVGRSRDGEARHDATSSHAVSSVLAVVLSISLAAVAFTALVVTDLPAADASRAVAPAGNVQDGQVRNGQVRNGQWRGQASRRVVTVLPGQSLWQIAGLVEPGRNAGDVAAEIQAANDLPSASLQPGQVLVVP